jgi:hypothetical protein
MPEEKPKVNKDVQKALTEISAKSLVPLYKSKIKALQVENRRDSGVVFKDRKKLIYWKDPKDKPKANPTIEVGGGDINPSLSTEIPTENQVRYYFQKTGLAITPLSLRIRNFRIPLLMPVLPFLPMYTNTEEQPQQDFVIHIDVKNDKANISMEPPARGSYEFKVKYSAVMDELLLRDFDTVNIDWAEVDDIKAENIVFLFEEAKRRGLKVDFGENARKYILNGPSFNGLSRKHHAELREYILSGSLIKASDPDRISSKAVDYTHPVRDDAAYAVIEDRQKYKEINAYKYQALKLNSQQTLDKEFSDTDRHNAGVGDDNGMIAYAIDHKRNADGALDRATERTIDEKIKALADQYDSINQRFANLELAEQLINYHTQNTLDELEQSNQSNDPDAIEQKITDKLADGSDFDNAKKELSTAYNQERDDLIARKRALDAVATTLNLDHMRTDFAARAKQEADRAEGLPVRGPVLPDLGEVDKKTFDLLNGYDKSKKQVVTNNAKLVRLNEHGQSNFDHYHVAQKNDEIRAKIAANVAARRPHAP